MNYDNISCFNVDNNICFSVNNMDEKHTKSFPGKDTNLLVNKYKQTFMDFTHKKIGEMLSAGNLSGLSNKKNAKWQRNSCISTDTETPDPDASDLQVPILGQIPKCPICSDVSRREVTLNCHQYMQL